MDPTDHLNPLESQPGLQLYTQICFCYPVSDSSNISGIIDVLTKGLERLAIGFPWIAGQVAHEDGGEGSSGTFRIVSFAQSPRLIVKNLRDDPSVPSLDAMKAASFPSTMLDEELICPRHTLPTPEEAASGFPVFLVQATFISGGLLLTFNGQHQAMDMTGQGEIIRLFSKACNNEPFTESELSSGNVARANIISLFPSTYMPGQELSRQLVKPNPTPAPIPAEQLQCQWTYFNFTSSSLNSLKALATSTLPPDTPFVSTDDALSAFIWHRLTLARIPRLPQTTNSTFARAINVRSHFSITPTYLGLLQNMSYNEFPLSTFANEPLGYFAAALRSQLGTEELRFRTQALATLLARSADKEIANLTANFDLSRDIMLSSWAGVECCDLDFGLGVGKPVCVRRPKFGAVESLIYLMPKDRDGEIAVMVCLREEDLQGLRGDEFWNRFAEYVG